MSLILSANETVNLPLTTNKENKIDNGIDRMIKNNRKQRFQNEQQPDTCEIRLHPVRRIAKFGNTKEYKALPLPYLSS